MITLKNINKPKSLSFKLWSYFVIFAALIMIILWLLQIVFLNTFYNRIKTNQIINVGRQIAIEYETDNFQQTIDELSYKNALSTLVFDTTGRVIAVSQSDNFERRPVLPLIDNFSTFLNSISQSQTGEIHYTYENKRIQSQTIIYGKVLESNENIRTYLFLSMPLEPVSSTVSILQKQLKYIIITVLVLSFIVSYFFSRRISEPISKISSSAKKLGTGDYTVIFEKADYTEINELAGALNYATRELSKTDQLRRELIANVSHDLRTPLTIIKSYAEMIRDISGDNPVKRDAHTGVIINETDRLSMLVQDVLDLSSLQSMVKNPGMNRLNFSETVENILVRFDYLQQTLGYTFDISIEKDLFIYADKAKLEQVIYNLIGNAVNFTGDDRKITVIVQKSDNKAIFKVKDSGKGIPEEDLPFIWDRYYKSGQSHRSYVIGTGLGLSIVKTILELHKAPYGVDSKPGKGSEFWFGLPIVQN